MDNHVEYDPHKCALLAKGSMTIQGRGQEEVAKKIGKTRSLLNLYLNRKLNFLSEDIGRLLSELGVEHIGAKLSGRKNEKAN
jgi:hypothetical protein